MDFYLPGLYKYNWMGLFPNDFQNYITDHGENQQQAAYWTFGVKWSVLWNEWEISNQTFVIERVVIYVLWSLRCPVSSLTSVPFIIVVEQNY